MDNTNYILIFTDDKNHCFFFNKCYFISHTKCKKEIKKTVIQGDNMENIDLIHTFTNDNKMSCDTCLTQTLTRERSH